MHTCSVIESATGNRGGEDVLGELRGSIVESFPTPCAPVELEGEFCAARRFLGNLLFCFVLFFNLLLLPREISPGRSSSCAADETAGTVEKGWCAHSETLWLEG